jgi:hypothetical protein
MRHGGFYIHQVSIRIMFHHEPTGIKPVIEYLTPQHMPSYTPAKLIPFTREKIVSQLLDVEVVDLKCSMRDTWFLPSFRTFEEESMMISEFKATVDVEEGRYGLLVYRDHV